MDLTGPATANEPAHALLAAWANYYVITGSAAAALTGLQFVVQTLIAQSDVPSPTGNAAEHTVAAFATPTVVHFAAVLLLSAGLSAPWPSVASARLALLAAGLGGLAYAVVVFRRTRRQTAYAPVMEDWVWHVALPMTAYGGIAGGAGLVRDTQAAFFVVAAMSLLLLCVGVHNAWDTVTYLTARRRPGRDPASEVGAAPQ
ncbi:MAG TPA: hypothetical protein VGD56_10615 [Gemmatirosa sp.]